MAGKWFESPDRLVSLLSQNRKAKSTLTDDQLYGVTTLCEASKVFLNALYAVFVASDIWRPLLRQYSNDGTPIRVNCYSNEFKVEGGSLSRCSGYHSHDLLVQLAFVRAFVAGALEPKVKLNDDLQLTNSKAADAIFMASLPTHTPLSKYGHKGINIEVKNFDRALASAPFHRFRKHHLLTLTEIGIDDDIETNRVQYLSEWNALAACVLHDVHKALF